MTIQPLVFSLIAFSMTIMLSLVVACLVKLVLIIIKRSEDGLNKLTNGRSKAGHP